MSTNGTKPARNGNGHKPYPEGVRRWAVSIAAAKGVPAAKDETGVPKATIHRWAKELGVEVFSELSAVEQTRHASIARQAQLAQAAVERVDLLAKVSKLGLEEAARILEAHEAGPEHLSGVVGAFTRAHHDLRLEQGESTENVGVMIGRIMDKLAPNEEEPDADRP